MLYAISSQFIDDCLEKRQQTRPAHQVLFQYDIVAYSVPVVFRGKASCAGNDRRPCQALQRSSGTPQVRPQGWPVSAHDCVAPFAKDDGHSMQGAPCHER